MLLALIILQRPSRAVRRLSAWTVSLCAIDATMESNIDSNISLCRKYNCLGAQWSLEKYSVKDGKRAETSSLNSLFAVLGHSQPPESIRVFVCAWPSKACMWKAIASEVAGTFRTGLHGWAALHLYIAQHFCAFRGCCPNTSGSSNFEFLRLRAGQRLSCQTPRRTPASQRTGGSCCCCWFLQVD